MADTQPITVDDANHRDVATALRMLNGVKDRTPASATGVLAFVNLAREQLMGVQLIHFQRRLDTVRQYPSRLLRAVDGLSEVLEDEHASVEDVRTAAISVCQTAALEGLRTAAAGRAISRARRVAKRPVLMIHLPAVSRSVTLGADVRAVTARRQATLPRARRVD